MSDFELPYPLTPAQKQIATAPPDQPQLVLAAPGTGKTHTVIARIWYLVEVCGLPPRQELLVLCFSRTAAREIMLRVTSLIRDQHVHDDLRFVSVRTFDSFVTSLLLNAVPNRSLNSLDYNERIQLAVNALQDPESGESESVAGIRHLIVDEIQDLVGVRAELVRQLITRIPGEFTLLGDPAQAIYGFAARAEDNALNLDGLLRWLVTQPWLATLRPTELTENHRATGPMAEVSSSLRRQLLMASKNDNRALERLRQFISSLNSSGTVEQPGPALQEPAAGTVCILCRTNGEVLQIATLLGRQGLRFHLRSRPEDKGLPAWIARALTGAPMSRLAPKDFSQLWTERIQRSDQPTAEQAWHWLKRVEGREQSDLSLSTLLQQLGSGQRLSDDADAFLEDNLDGVALSTVHAVKGREFDHVIILGPQDEVPAHNLDMLEEARVLYVAATRARQELTRLERRGLPRMGRLPLSGGRSRLVSRRDASAWFIEVGLPGDIQRGSAVSTYVYQNQSEAVAAQDYLWQILRPGMEVSLRRVVRGKYVFYSIQHVVPGQPHSRILGQMSRSFVNDVGVALQKYGNGKRFYPAAMNAHVAAVVTQVLDAFPQHTHQPFTTVRLCLEVRLRGMGFLMKEQQR